MTLQCKSRAQIQFLWYLNTSQQEKLQACDCIEPVPWNVPKLRCTATLFYFGSSPVVMSTGITEANQTGTHCFFLPFVFLKYLINMKRNWI